MHLETSVAKALSFPNSSIRFYIQQANYHDQIGLDQTMEDLGADAVDLDILSVSDSTIREDSVLSEEPEQVSGVQTQPTWNFVNRTEDGNVQSNIFAASNSDDGFESPRHFYQGRRNLRSSTIRLFEGIDAEAKEAYRPGVQMNASDKRREKGQHPDAVLGHSDATLEKPASRKPESGASRNHVSVPSRGISSNGREPACVVCRGRKRPCDPRISTCLLHPAQRVNDEANIKFILKIRKSPVKEEDGKKRYIVESRRETSSAPSEAATGAATSPLALRFAKSVDMARPPAILPPQKSKSSPAVILPRQMSKPRPAAILPPHNSRGLSPPQRPKAILPAEKVGRPRDGDLSSTPSPKRQRRYPEESYAIIREIGRCAKCKRTKTKCHPHHPRP
jgi:hypothetical protein